MHGTNMKLSFLFFSPLPSSQVANCSTHLHYRTALHPHMKLKSFLLREKQLFIIVEWQDLSLGTGSLVGPIVHLRNKRRKCI